MMNEQKIAIQNFQTNSHPANKNLWNERTWFKQTFKMWGLNFTQPRGDIWKAVSYKLQTLISLCFPPPHIQIETNIKNYNKQNKKRRWPVQKLQSEKYQFGRNTNVITVVARACSCISSAWYYTPCGIMCVCLIARPVKYTLTLLPTWNCIAVKTCVSYLPCTICIRVKTNPMFSHEVQNEP